MVYSYNAEGHSASTEPSELTSKLDLGSMVLSLLTGQLILEPSQSVYNDAYVII